MFKGHAFFDKGFGKAPSFKKTKCFVLNLHLLTVSTNQRYGKQVWTSHYLAWTALIPRVAKKKCSLQADRYINFFLL